MENYLWVVIAIVGVLFLILIGFLVDKRIKKTKKNNISKSSTPEVDDFFANMPEKSVSPIETNNMENDIPAMILPADEIQNTNDEIKPLVNNSENQENISFSNDQINEPFSDNGFVSEEMQGNLEENKIEEINSNEILENESEIPLKNDFSLNVDYEEIKEELDNREELKTTEQSFQKETSDEEDLWKF